MTNNRSLGTVERSRRATILEAAKRLFAERGYHATSVRDIAAAVDLQGGSLYAHIASKEELLWELVSSAAARFVSGAAAVEAAEPDPRQRLRRLVEAHVAVMTDDPANAVVFHHEWRALPPPRREAIAAQRRAYEAIFRRAIEDGVRAGVFHAPDPKFVTLLVLSLGNWLYQWYRPDGPLTPAQISARFMELIERALGVPQGPPREPVNGHHSNG
ncbi:MAG: TetR/AcrR family transcriptional regulator [Chloroflexota bacterium]